MLKPGGRFFFEEVTRNALQRVLYRAFFKHPTENRFQERDFIEEIRRQGFELTCDTRRVLFGDIFIGAAIVAKDSSTPALR